MKTDKQGCSTCPNGQESYEDFETRRGIKMIAYDYRTELGVLFSTISLTLETARLKRDNWLKQRELK